MAASHQLTLVDERDRKGLCGRCKSICHRLLRTSRGLHYLGSEHSHRQTADGIRQVGPLTPWLNTRCRGIIAVSSVGRTTAE